MQSYNVVIIGNLTTEDLGISNKYVNPPSEYKAYKTLPLRTPGPDCGLIITTSEGNLIGLKFTQVDDINHYTGGKIDLVIIAKNHKENINKCSTSSQFLIDSYLLLIKDTSPCYKTVVFNSINVSRMSYSNEYIMLRIFQILCKIHTIPSFKMEYSAGPTPGQPQATSKPPEMLIIDDISPPKVGYHKPKESFNVTIETDRIIKVQSGNPINNIVVNKDSIVIYF